MASPINRVKTGVPGMDKLMEGGIPEGSVVLLSGGAGCGKTTFSCQFIMEGLNNGENCLYITLEESPEDIKKDALQFGWDLSKHESSGAFRIMYYDPFELKEIITRLKDLITVNKIKRLVIDSITLFGLYLKEEYNIRKELYHLVAALKETGCTALLLSEVTEGDSKKFSRYGVEEFVADGVIVLYYMGLGEGIFRNIEVRKMR
ncbi:MAG: AAA family ATPase, partial [Candidatus Aenigmarchaeota archaeon]|nr:AAA family ATPase [Candidatus Aenigmarchaeota archaeon]